MRNVVIGLKFSGQSLYFRQMMAEGVMYEVLLSSPFPPSLGTQIPVQVWVATVPDFPADDPLTDASILGLVCVDLSWDMSYIPSNRPLWAIMQDVADHTKTHPTHGAMCACMDQYSREVRLHLRKAMPPDTQIYHETDCPEPGGCGWCGNPQDVIQARVMAHQRISHVLGMVMRNF